MFAAVVEPDGVWLVEYRREKSGYRVVQHASDVRRMQSAREAFESLASLVRNAGARRATLRVALQHFGAFHHIMTLPRADDRILRPIIRREMQRVFNVSDPVVAFTSGTPVERRSPERADATTAPNSYFIGGAPRETVGALVDALALPGLRVDCVTLVPEAIRRVHEVASSDDDVTASLVCLASGPHLAFFINGRMELALEPPVALETESVIDPAMVVAQVERGVVYLRQQFRGAEPKLLFLAAPPGSFDTLAAALEERFGIRVRPLMPQIPGPEAVVAMGAVLEGDDAHPLDILPHPPSLEERVRDSFRGTQGIATTTSAVAAVVAFWAMAQANQVRRENQEVYRLRDRLNADLQALAPVRQAVERRARFMQRITVVDDVRVERQGLSRQLAGLANIVPPSMHFDSLAVSRTQTGWSTQVHGEVATPSAAQSVRDLNDFFQGLGNRPGVTAAALDRFDYPASPPRDSGAKTPDDDRLVRIHFQVSFASSLGANGQ